MYSVAIPIPPRFQYLITQNAANCGGQIGLSPAGNHFASFGSGTTAESDLSPGAEAEEDGLFSSSGLESFGRGGQESGAEHVGVEHRQAAKQSKWSPVTLWRQKA